MAFRRFGFITNGSHCECRWHLNFFTLSTTRPRQDSRHYSVEFGFGCTLREKTRCSRCTVRSWLTSCTSIERRCFCPQAPWWAAFPVPQREDLLPHQSRPSSMLPWLLS